MSYFIADLIIYTDYSKAFDRIDHGTLINTFTGKKENLLQLFKFFTEGPRKICKVHRQCSYLTIITIFTMGTP